MAGHWRIYGDEPSPRLLIVHRRELNVREAAQLRAELSDHVPTIKLASVDELERMRVQTYGLVVVLGERRDVPLESNVVHVGVNNAGSVLHRVEEAEFGTRT